MFVLLLSVTFVISFFVSWVVVQMFNKPIDAILNRIIADAISAAWSKYLKFAIYVVGISSGVRIRALEKFITSDSHSGDSVEVIALNSDRWVLEVYRTIIETLQGIAWMLLVFFLFALIAYVIVAIFGKKKVADQS